MTDRTHVWVVNRVEEVDPIYVFTEEDQTVTYADRFRLTTVSEEVVMGPSAGALFLIDTAEDS